MPNGQELSFDVPIIKMADYTIEDIFREELYMLIPFYIFNYGDTLKEIDGSEEKLELDLPSFRIYDQGKAEGKAEGEQERKELKNEVDRLRKELEELKARQ